MLACAHGQQLAVIVPSRSRADVQHTVTRFPPHCTCEAFQFHVRDRDGRQWCDHLTRDEATRCRWTERVYGPPGGDMCPACGGPLEEERQEPSVLRAGAPTDEDVEHGRAALPGSSLDPVADPQPVPRPRHVVPCPPAVAAARLPNQDAWERMWARFERQGGNE